MNKVKFICIVLVFVLTVYGCQMNSENNAGSREKAVIELSEISEVSKNINFGDIEYNLEYDNLNCFAVMLRNFAATGTGYYFFDMNEDASFKLMYYDKAQSMCVPVCQRSDCEHDDVECDAYFENTDGRIWYYDEAVYYMDFMVENGTITYILYKASPDGSVRSKVCELYTEDYDINQPSLSPELAIHRGYIYFSCSNREISYMFKLDVNGKGEPEEICRCSGYVTGIYNMQGYGDGVMFESFCYKEETSDEYNVEQKILYYSQDTEEISLLVDDNLGVYAVTKDSIIYSDSKDMFMYSLKDYTVKTLVKDEVDTVSYDGQYIYLDNIGEDINRRKIDVYSADGTCIDTIDMSGNEMDSNFGDESYLFQYVMEDQDFAIYALDKSQLGSGSHEWIKVK